MSESRGPVDPFADRNAQARRDKAEIDDWLAGRGSYVMVALLVVLVVALVLGLARI
jgi:hypothetical protein